jgi:isopropylmalate/homocitrate/citramalate synthase
MSSSIKIVECPRDAMQGIVEFIPTADKITYINSLLKCGFDTIDLEVLSRQRQYLKCEIQLRF